MALTAAVWGAIAASSLLIGSVLTYWLKPSRRAIGLIMGFGAGTLISAIAYDLVEDAAASGAPLRVALGLTLGALAFYAGDRWVERSAGSGRQRSNDPPAEGGSLSILVGTLLDGIPESFILGASLLTGGGVNAVFLAAVFISNLPEAMGATADLTAAGWPKNASSASGWRSLSSQPSRQGWVSGSSRCGRSTASWSNRLRRARC